MYFLFISRSLRLFCSPRIQYLAATLQIVMVKPLAGRPKDRNDTQALCQRLKVRTSRQARQLVDRYIPNKQLQQLNHLDDTLNDVFP
jgi:hypothetical protein